MIAEASLTTIGEPLVAFVGEPHTDIRDNTRWRSLATGAELNVAVGVARLGHSVTFIGRIGTDVFGDMITTTLRREGVSTRHLVTDPDAPTGLLFRDLPPLPPATVEYRRQESAGSRLNVDDLPTAIDTAWLHVTGITPAVSPTANAAVVEALTRCLSATTSLDLNIRRQLWPSRQEMEDHLLPLAARVDVVFATDDELVALTQLIDPEAAAQRLLISGVQLVVLRQGGHGVLVVDGEGATRIRAHRWFDPPVDAVGAGDAFVSTFIAARLAGHPVSTAAAHGQQAGARVAMSVGDVAGLPRTTVLDPSWGTSDVIR